MADVMPAGRLDTLWFKAKADLAQYVPDSAVSPLLMCCCCGRWLPRSAFSLDHIIPQRHARHDPPIVRLDATTPLNVRTGNLLLCQRPLKVGGKAVHGLGCNGWKGRYYDQPIAEMFSSISSISTRRSTALHLVAGLSMSYLAMVAEYGYRVVLMPSGILMREQFFSPLRFLPELPTRFQMTMANSRSSNMLDDVWSQPFRFSIERDVCIVTTRNLSFMVPVSSDPRIPITGSLRFLPSYIRQRPDFSTRYD